jgi:putative ABC transport system permease protein
MMGARRTQLLNQFLGESVLLALIATTFAIVLVVLFLPAFNNLMNTKLSLNLFENIDLFIILLVLSLFIGLLAGIFPSKVIATIKPIVILNKIGLSGNRTNRFSMRNVLVVVQFAIAIILITLTILVKSQMDYISNKDMGYDKEHIVTISTLNHSIKQNIETIKSELLKNPNILSVATSHNLPNNINTFTVPDWLCITPDSCISINYNETDFSFIDLYNIEIVEGRNFSKDYSSDKNGAFLINESAAKTGVWDSAIGEEIDHWDGTKGKIVGVFKDFNSESVHSAIAPLYIFLDEGNFDYVSIKIDAKNIPATISSIETVFKECSPNYPFQYSFFDELFNRTYLAERRQGTIFSYFAFIAIIISCLGLLGLATYLAENRTKEIGIRKVNGAKISEILVMLNKDFIKWVAIAFVVATPIAWFVMNKWLENFAYKTTLSWWIFALAGLLAVAIALLTVSWQSWRAATRNPVEALRYE